MIGLNVDSVRAEASPDAQGLLELLRKAGLHVKELIIKDTRDPSTWTFVGLDDEQVAKAIALLNDILNPIQVPAPREAMTLRALIFLFRPQEWVDIRKSVDTNVIYYRSMLLADRTLVPTDPFVTLLVQASVGAKIFTQERADALLFAINPPV